MALDGVGKKGSGDPGPTSERRSRPDRERSQTESGKEGSTELILQQAQDDGIVILVPDEATAVGQR